MIQIDFEKFNKAGLKPILTKLEKEGLTVADVQADNKAKRESGYQVKTATITFDSGQKLMLKAKAGGSIYQVRLNNKVSGQAITGGTPYEVDLTAQLSAYSRIALGRVKISYTFVDTSGAAGYLTFRPVGGGANDYFAYQNFDASSTVSDTLEIPLSPDNRFWFHSTKNGTLTIRVHGILRE